MTIRHSPDCDGWSPTDWCAVGGVRLWVASWGMRTQQRWLCERHYGLAVTKPARRPLDAT